MADTPWVVQRGREVSPPLRSSTAYMLICEASSIALPMLQKILATGKHLFETPESLEQITCFGHLDIAQNDRP